MFKDVKKTDWFYDALKRIHKLKRIAGFPDGTFQPNKALTRAEYVAGEDAANQNRFAVISKVKPAVCKISGNGGMGSGYLVSPDTVVTNVHVALCGYNGKTDKIDGLEINFIDGTTIEPKNIRIPWGDGAKDCAVIKIPPVDIEPLEFAVPYPGEDCYVIGNPVGRIASVSKGIVSHDRRYKETMGEMVRWLQVDCAINPGNSGGALVNQYGELIGMPTWKLFYTGEATPRPLEGLGFCLHIEGIKAAIAEAEKIEKDRQVLLNLEVLDKPFVLIESKR